MFIPLYTAESLFPPAKLEFQGNFPALPITKLYYPGNKLFLRRERSSLVVGTIMVSQVKGQFWTYFLRTFRCKNKWWKFIWRKCIRTRFFRFWKRNKMLLQSFFILSSKPVHVEVKNRKATSKLKLRLSCVILRSWKPRVTKIYDLQCWMLVYTGNFHNI